jgi:hypothetical protein
MDETNTPPPLPPEPASALTPASRTGLPWEHRDSLGLVKAFTDTLMMVLTKPSQAYSVMQREGGLGSPLLYAIIGGVFGYVVYFVYMLLMPSMGFAANPDNALFGVLGMGFGLLFLIVLIPILVVIGAFIGGAILHVCLMIVGGAKQPFETTFRVMCFSSGSTSPLMIIPICGGMIAGIYNIVLNCIGLARAHEIDTGKAVLAVILPVIICCGGGFLLAMMFGVMGAMAGANQ